MIKNLATVMTLFAVASAYAEGEKVSASPAPTAEADSAAKEGEHKCMFVGNEKTKTYRAHHGKHMKNKGMCFSTEEEAQKAGFKKK